MNRALTRQEGDKTFCVECGELVSVAVDVIETLPYWSNNPAENRKQVDTFNRVLTEARSHYAKNHSEYWAERCAAHDETVLMKYKQEAA